MRALALACVLLAAAPPAGTASRQDDAIAREVYLMGTRASLATYDADRQRGVDRIERMLRALEETEAQLSTWVPSSEISALNARAGKGPFVLSRQLCAAFVEIDRWTAETGGAFDPAVGALVSAWDLHGRGRVAREQEIAAALGRSGWAHVNFDRPACAVNLAAGVSLDVGAWGKGNGLDRARSTGGDSPWLIDLGGQVAVQGAPPNTDGWRIAIAHPLQRDAPVLEVRLREGSLATSAGSERDLLVDGQRVGHVLDPRTGKPARFTGSTTVWHASAMVADMLSTALFVMGPDAGIGWAEARGIAALYLIPDGASVVRKATTAFTKRFGPVSASPAPRK